MVGDGGGTDGIAEYKPESGGHVSSWSTGSHYPNGGGKGGSQTSAGDTYGGFGYGSNANTSNMTGAGGGGWYGGGGGTNHNQGGGGGSGYVYTSSTASNYPSGCLLNESYYLTDAQTIAGNQSFTSPTGTNETGHSGNGYARITALD